ncbi:hypothetical protein LCGC14_2535820, partial [marine sediment metagenome]
QAQYTNALDGLITQYRNEITGASNVPFIVGKVPLWSSQYGAGVAAALEDTPSRVSRTALVQTDDLVDGGDSLHFDAPSLRELGKRYFSKLQEARNNTLAPTVPEGVTNLTGTADNNRVVLSWTAPNNGGSVITDYIIEYKEATANNWLTLTGDTGLLTTVEVTGLTNETAYQFRVSSVNVIGVSSVSNVATATPIEAVAGVNPEAGAEGHWLFGSDNTSYSDLTTGKKLVPNTTPDSTTTPINNTGYMTIPQGKAQGLKSTLPDKPEETLIFVVRKDNLTDGGTVFGGAFSQGEGSAIYFQNAQTQARWNVRGINYQSFGMFNISEWVFLALSLQNIDTTGCLIRSFQGDSETPYFNELLATSGKTVSPLNTYSVGSVFYDNPQFQASFDIAEFMVFPTLKTEAELQAIYERSVTRMAERGIALA